MRDPGQTGTQQLLPAGMMMTNGVGRTLHKTTIRTMKAVHEGNLITEGDQTFTDQGNARAPVGACPPR